MKFGLLPFGGERLVERRLAGRDPKDMIVVSFVDHIPAMFTLNSTKFICKPKFHYDWRFLTGLEICMLIDASVPGVGRIIQELVCAVKPHSRVYAWDVERLVGAEFFWLPTADSLDRPRHAWEWKVESLPWIKPQNDEYCMA
jgi:hypothetical protein